MSKINIVEGIKKENAKEICCWTNQNGEKFLEQWAGSNFTFPLTVEEIYDQKNMYSIFLYDEFVGIIQKIRIEDSNIHIGRFFINPKRTGIGLGGKALLEFVKMIFKDLSVDSISLTVFDYNISAKKLYEKLGFEVCEIIDKPQKKYIMKKIRN